MDKDNRLIITLRDYDSVKNLSTVKDELQDLQGVVDVTTINRVPGTGNSFVVLPVENDTGGLESLGTHHLQVGMNFVEAMNVQVVQGRGFSEDIAADEWASVLVNESLVRHVGWVNPIGKRIQYGSEFASVVGVVKDFHYSGLHNVVGPLLIKPLVDTIGDVPEHRRALVSRSIIVVISEFGVQETMRQIEDTVKKFDPAFSIEPDFLDDRLAQQYRSESNLMQLTGIFALTCILISVIGLIGLTAFSAEQRTKEIGIRKVLGASEGQIVILLSRHVFLLVLVAAVPASAVSYVVIEKWLNRFAYHIDINWYPFVAATSVVACAALITAITLSMKAARAKVVDNLRYE